MKKELSSLARAFVADGSRVSEHEMPEAEANWFHYLSTKPLVEGALAVLKAEGDQLTDAGWSARDLLEAFLDAMEIGADANEQARIAKGLVARIPNAGKGKVKGKAA